MRKLTLLTLCAIQIALVRSVPATVLTDAQKPGAADFDKMRVGTFTHMVYGSTIAPDGGRYKSLDDFANAFDVEAYADKVKQTGAEYVIFTAWHAAMYNLGPNDALEKWLPGHTAKRDLIGEVADALNARGIKLIIYAHPNDGHDLKPEEQERIGFVLRDKAERGLLPRVNDFINEVYAETARRYAGKPNVLGFWWDSWMANGSAVDVPRLRKTVLDAMPHAIIFSNYFNPEFIDYMSHECYYGRGSTDNIDTLVVSKDNQTSVFAGNWQCDNLKASSAYSAKSLFQFTVLNACSGAPGGMAWALSPAGDGRTWPRAGIDALEGMGRLLAKVRPAVCGVLPSPNWPVRDRSKFSESPGFGATRSPDGTKEYLHVLCPPDGKTLNLPLPFERFSKAHLLSNGNPVRYKTSAIALSLSLGPSDSWDPNDTVIVLKRDPSVVHRWLLHDDPGVSYEGSWRSSPNSHFSATPGAAAVITFKGTRFIWHGAKGPDQGAASVSVDGGAPVVVDCQRAARSLDEPVFSTDLPPGRHTVRIEVAPPTGDDKQPKTSSIFRFLILEPN